MQRYFAKEKQNNTFILTDSDLRHIRLVMRMKDKDEIEVVYDNKVYLCCIESVKFDVKILIKKCFKNSCPNILNITLVIPILKEQKMDYIFQKATELGVSKIIPVITERTIVKLDETKGNKKLERWNKICKEASEQSKRSNIPIIESPTTFKSLECIDGEKLVCSTIIQDYTLKKMFQTNQFYDKIVIVIGPEGGLSLKEENYLNSIGFKSVSLGKRIMRVETVPLFLLSVLNYINME